MRIENSVIKGDVAARGDSSITLIDSLVESQGVNDNGSSFFGNLFVLDNATITLVNTVVEGEVSKSGNGTVVER